MLPVRFVVHFGDGCCCFQRFSVDCAPTKRPAACPFHPFRTITDHALNSMATICMVTGGVWVIAYCCHVLRTLFAFSVKCGCAANLELRDSVDPLLREAHWQTRAEPHEPAATSM